MAKASGLKCLECGALMRATTGDHAYGFDRGKKIKLHGLTIQRCPEGHYEVEIPRMGPLHEAIGEALNTLRVPRDSLSFSFTPGPKGIMDGAWGVVIKQP